jgi:hypothetical protein
MEALPPTSVVDSLAEQLGGRSRLRAESKQRAGLSRTRWDAENPVNPYTVHRQVIPNLNIRHE